MRTVLVLVAVTFFAVPAAYAAGPTGYGPIKIGMTKAELETLKSDQGIYLAGPLADYQYDHKYSKPQPGRDKYDARIATPLRSEPLKAVVTFEEGKLVELYINLNESTALLEQLKGQIAEKYGQPKVDNTMKEEQCLYRGGQNFKISSGAISNVWIETTTAFGEVRTSLTNFEFRSCPVNLRYGMMDTQLVSLSIHVVKPKSKTPNPF